MNLETVPTVVPENLPAWRRVLRQVENLFVVVPLALCALLPFLETILRRFHTGFAGSIVFVQNFTLIIGMAGAAVAARENRLLSFSTVSSFLKGRAKTAAGVLSHGASAAICALLCLASVQFVSSEKATGAKLALGIPNWIVELVLPAGFGLIAMRLVWHAAQSWKGRLIALLIAGAIIAFGVVSPIAPEKLVTPALILLLFVTILGAPVFTAIGGAALILFWGDHSPIAAIPLKHH